ncbi:hypothetical protein, partial [Rhizobium vallis]|uniref:hypothetical protein n=1 Tax=Rhizobium vallis TaxID=634290 RepID=UPI001ABFEEBE
RSKLPPRATNQQSPIRLISLERETSSPAAPPPSFSEWAYRTNQSDQSTALFEKNEISFRLLFLQEKLRTALKCDRFPDSERPNTAGKNERPSTFRGKNALLSPAPRHHHNLLVLKRHTIHTGKRKQTAFLG